MARAKRLQGLDCSAPAEDMIRLVLRSQVKAMCKHRERALNWKDPEGVHDMRVLSRRLRSAISDFRPYLRKASLLESRLRTIADALGAVRDEDVALIALEKLKTGAKGGAVAGIEILIQERRKQRQDARNKLKAAIRESIIEEFRTDFQAKLRRLTVTASDKASAKSTTNNPLLFSRVGGEIIVARLKELRAASPHLYFPFQITELHQLRIFAKRLRYAVELFSPCFSEFGDLAKEIALFQTSLGELHDCDVWIESLGTRLKKIDRTGRGDLNTSRMREGAGWLLRHFATARSEQYRDAVARWQQWQADQFLENLEATVESVPQSAQKFISN